MIGQLKIYSYIAACVVFAGAFGWYSWKLYSIGAVEAEAELKTYKAQVELDKVKDEHERAKARLEVEQRYSMELEGLRARIIGEESKRMQDIADLERDLDGARVGLRIAVRQIPGFCKAGDSIGAETATAELDGKSERGYLDHTKAIAKTDSWVAHAMGFIEKCGRK